MKSFSLWSAASVSLVAFVLLASCSGDKGTRPGGDTTPPAAIQDLAVESATLAGVSLRWTAPGDDGSAGAASRYDLRFSARVITAATWDSATVAAPAPVPGAPGATQRHTVFALGAGTWWFALRSADEVPNWSALSNVVSTVIVDTIPPAPVGNLAATSSDGHTATLTWTSPGSHGSAGTAAEYDLRYALAEITAATWDAATRVTGVAPPAPAGTQESFTVRGLEPTTPYFFALKTANDEPRWSELSSVATATTPSFWQLTMGPGASGNASSPSWSPDGTQIAFAANWGGNQDIYTIPAVGGAAVRLTDDPRWDSTPAWSPLGDKIAFVSHPPGDTWVLQVMDVVPESTPIILATRGMPAIGKPSWSPDGTRIAYGPGYWQMTSSDTIYVVPSSGGTPAVLIAGGRDWGNYAPAWSPDGTKLAIVSTPGMTWDIWIVSLPGGDRSRLTMSPIRYLNSSPCWSPDGSRIAFESKRSGNYEIYRVPAAGGALVQVTSDPGSDREPAWSPDGTMIAFSSDRSGRSEIWIQAVK